MRGGIGGGGIGGGLNPPIPPPIIPPPIIPPIMVPGLLVARSRKWPTTTLLPARETTPLYATVCDGRSMSVRTAALHTMVGKQTVGGGERKRRGCKSKARTYATYLKRVLNDVCGRYGGEYTSIGISKPGMRLVDQIVQDVEYRIAKNGFKMATTDHKTTLNTKHLQAATQLVLSGGLATAARENGTRSVASLL